MPPVSKVMPLPTSTTWVRAPRGRQSSSTRRGAAGRAAADGEDAAEALGGQLAPARAPRTVRPGAAGGRRATCSANHCRVLHRATGCWSGRGPARSSAAVVRAAVDGVGVSRPGRPTSERRPRRSAGASLGARSAGTGTTPASSPSARPRTAAGGDVGRQRDRDVRLIARAARASAAPAARQPASSPSPTPTSSSRAGVRGRAAGAATLAGAAGQPARPAAARRPRRQVVGQRRRGRDQRGRGVGVRRRPSARRAGRGCRAGRARLARRMASTLDRTSRQIADADRPPSARRP